jgi:probable HAF family extracellular repeat protein
MRHHLHLASFAACLLLVARVAASQTVTTIDVPGATSTAAFGINDRSQIVGFFADATGNGHGYLRSNGRFTVIDVPNASQTSANGINNLGQIVGYFIINDQSHGFLLDRGRFSTIDPPGAIRSQANSINDAGQIVGDYLDASGSQHGFLWTHGQFNTIDFPNTTGATAGAFGINNIGQIAGRFADAGSRVHGYRLLARGNFATFDAPGGFTQPNGINDRGEIVGEQIGNRIRGFLLSFGSFTNIDVSGSIETIAIGINNRGQIVGEYLERPSGIPLNHGFVMTPPNAVEDVSGLPSPDRTRVQAVSVIFDGDLAMWTLGPDEEILRDGVQVAGGYGSQVLWFRGAIYVLGDDDNWWQWTGSTWVFAGAQDPSL